MEEDRTMKPLYFASCLILLGMCSGCVDVVNSVDGSACQTVCDPSQICVADQCFDTCSLNKPCALRNQACINNICIAQDISCAPDTRKCSDDGRMVLACLDGIDYSEEKICASDETCESGVCIKNACENGTMRCSGNNIEICKNNAFTLYSECESPQVCREGSFECEIPAECHSGVKKCDENGNILICENEHWISFKTCPNGYACNTATLECAETAACVTGSFKCSFNQVFACANSQWMLYKECGENMLCDGGQCVSADCVEGQTRCNEAEGIAFRQYCAGNHYASEPCLSSEVCVMDGSEARCVPKICEPGSLKCENNTLYKCEDNQYVEALVCDSSSTCNLVEANCTPNCNNNTLEDNEECDGIQFKPGLTCASRMPNTIGELKCTKECTLDLSGCTDACDPSTEPTCSGTVLQKCGSNQKWEITDCAESGQLCNAVSGCYKPSFSGVWDYVQDFEKLKEVNTYAANSFTDNGISWNFKARTDVYDNNVFYGIEGTGLVLKADKSCFIKVSNIPKAVKSMGFDWRSWGGNNDLGELEIYINGNVFKTFEFDRKNTDKSEFSVELNLSVTEFEFKLKTAKAGRIIIDNVRWAYN